MRLSEFTYADRVGVLDLLVNNEQVLMKVHEALFSQNTLNFKSKNILRSPSDKITMNTDANLYGTTDTSLMDQISVSKTLPATKALTLTHLEKPIMMSSKRQSLQDPTAAVTDAKGTKLPSIASTPQARSDALLSQAFFEVGHRR